MLARLLALALLVLAAPRTGQAACQQIILNAVDSGFYDRSGFHSPTDRSYTVGEPYGVSSSRTPHRNFFVFEIPSMTNQISAATLELFSFSSYSPEGSETFELREVTTPVTTLRAGGFGQVGVYADLGDGLVFGGRTYSTFFGTNGVENIPLNGAFVASANTTRGQLLALGGQLTTLDADPLSQEVLFLYSHAGFVTARLILTLGSDTVPVFDVHPLTQTALAGGEFTLFGNACGQGPIAFQWQRNGVNVPGATNTFLTLNNVFPVDSGDFALVASNPAGVVTSQVATVTVVPVLLSYFLPFPSSREVLAGDYVYFETGVYSLLPDVSFQWYRNGLPLVGEVNSTLAFQPVSRTNAGDYTLIVTNSAGAVTSPVVRLTVIAVAPTITLQPDSQSIRAGNSLVLQVGVTGAPAPTFQWRRNGVNLPGENLYYFYRNNVATNDAGAYTVVVSNEAGSVTSAVAQVSVYLEAPHFVQHPLDVTVQAGSTATLYAFAEGGPIPTLQWQFNGTNLPYATNTYFSIPISDTNHVGDYRVIASNLVGQATSTVARVSVIYVPPVFITPPASQTVVEGSQVTFYSYASGAPPPSYVLQRNGTNLAIPQRGNFFTLLEVSTNDAGSYTVIATNLGGSATSHVAQLTVTTAGAMDRWTRRNPLPQGNNLLALAHGNDTYVAVGERGAILVSTNGTNWTVQNLRTSVQLYGVAFGDGTFVATGDGGVILSSTDGREWTPRFSGVAGLITSVAYGNGRFVATTLYEYLALTSTNGVDWQGQLHQPLPFMDVTFGNGAFVAVGPAAALATSLDGVAWLPRTSPTNASLESVCYGNSLFVAVGDNGRILTSPDGVTWIHRPSGTTRRLIDVAWGAGRFVAVGTRGVIFTSVDGIAWSSVNSGTPDRLETVVFANDLFVTAGENGTTLTSADGVSWANQTVGTRRDLDGITVGDNLLVVVGKAGTILTSTNGIGYLERATGVTNDLHGVAYGNGGYVAVGDGSTILTSDDAVQWTRRVAGTNQYFKSAVWGDGLWVSVGTGGAIYTSTDTIEWTRRLSGTTFDLNEVAHGNGMFMVVGDAFPNPNGTVLVSSNGLDWFNRTLNAGKNFRAVTFANGQFVVAGNDGYLVATTNALSWRFRTTGITFDGDNLRGVAYAGGHWVVTGNDGIIITSTNNLLEIPTSNPDFTRRASRTLENLHGVRYFKGRFVTIGNRGFILQSGQPFGPSLTPRGWRPGEGFELALEGEDARVYRVEASTDFQTWTSLTTVTNPSPHALFLDTEASGMPRRFYRAVEP